MQHDLYDDKVFYYDWYTDVANLGDFITVMKTGETFEHKGYSYEIIEVDAVNQCFTIQEIVKNADDND